MAVSVSFVFGSEIEKVFEREGVDKEFCKYRIGAMSDLLPTNI